MKVKEISKGLFLYTFPNQFELCHTFFRLQEFYESPIKQVRGKYFTYEDVITYYAYDQKEKPAFTYFSDWNGFNVPGNVVDKFHEEFDSNFTTKELLMLNAIPYGRGYDYYLIGVVEGQEETMRHEVAHGFYYLNKKYKREMNKLLKQLPKQMVDRFKKELKKCGYCKQVMKDEIHAYLSTGLRNGMVSVLDYSMHWHLIQAFEKTFDSYYKEIKDEKII